MKRGRGRALKPAAQFTSSFRLTISLYDPQQSFYDLPISLNDLLISLYARTHTERWSSQASAICIGVACSEAAAAVSADDCRGVKPPSGKNGT